MQGSRTIGGQKIEYPKTDKAEMASVMVEIQPGKESGATCIQSPPTSMCLREY